MVKFDTQNQSIRSKRLVCYKLETLGSNLSCGLYVNYKSFSLKNAQQTLFHFKEHKRRRSQEWCLQLFWIQKSPKVSIRQVKAKKFEKM